MLYWRLLAYLLFVIAIVLSIVSFLQANFSIFLLALLHYFLSMVILITIKKLYQEPFQPNRTDYRKQRDSWWWDFLDGIIHCLDVLIELPIIAFRILLKIISNILQ